MTTNYIQPWSPTVGDLSDDQRTALKALSTELKPLIDLVSDGLLRACDFLMFMRNGWITGSAFDDEALTYQQIALTAAGQAAQQEAASTGRFRFVRFEFAEKSVCQNCGHNPISRCFHIQHMDTEQEMMVGSECVVLLLTPGEVENFELAERRMNRAYDQFERNNPPAREGESQGAYATRRVREMANALTAHKEWTAMLANDEPRQLSAESLRKQGYKDPAHYFFTKAKDEPTWAAGQRKALGRAWDEMCDAEWPAMVSRFEAKHQANRYDFDQETWNVRKI